MDNRENETPIQFVERIKSQHGWGDWYDILIYLFNHWETIEDNNRKYDNYPAGKQIYLIWRDLLKYYNKNKPHNNEHNNKTKSGSMPGSSKRQPNTGESPKKNSKPKDK